MRLQRVIGVMGLLGAVVVLGFGEGWIPARAQEASSGRSGGIEKGGNDETGPYEVVKDWPQPLHGNKPGDWSWGRVAAIWAESPDRVFVTQSGELPILDETDQGGRPQRDANVASGKRERWEHIVMIFNREGKLIDSWDQHKDLIVWPHSIKIDPYDPQRHVWFIDRDAHSVYKFTNDGKQIVMRLGEYKVPGNDDKHFNMPTDIAWFPNGDFVISDGYQNTRVVKFSKDGKVLKTWGEPTPRIPGLKPALFRQPEENPLPNQLRLPHAIAVDAKQKVYVADRGNSRVQVFDSEGKFLDQWPNIRFPITLAVSKDQHVWVMDGLAQKFLKFDLNGRLLYSWGTFGHQPGQMWGTHSFSTDSEGNLYTAEVWGGRPQKFRPKKGVDKSKLIGELFNGTPTRR